MKKLIIANWKMLPETLGQAEAIIERTEECVRDLDREKFEVVVCPPFIYTEEVAKLLGEGVLAEAAVLGAQDIATQDEGALTGEVSGPQLARLGVRYVIIGHSERRWKLGESEETINEKLKAALRAGLTPVVCLGERTRLRQGFGGQAREGEWKDALAAQTVATFAGLTGGQISQCLIAYEPVWAISTNPDAKPDTPASAVQSMNFIRETIADEFDVSHTMFLYGGSVTPENVSAFLERPEVSGVLVGGVSVRADDFCRILSIASTLS